ncbi:Ribosomal protein S17/S11 [Trinorchestia longiramus]|nr:Ribosomal protein S17/S11 [Trinorchestia longiramus]
MGLKKKLNYTLAVEAPKILQNSSMLLARCMSLTDDVDPKVRVTRLLFNDFLKMYFRHYADIIVHDEKKIAKPGDVILIRKLRQPLSVEKHHEIVKVVYPLGDITDPLTGKKCVLGKYRSNVKLVDELYGRAPDAPEGFDYNKAPDRGWQQGRKDWSHKEGYQRWHDFEPGHPLHNDPAAT